MSLAFYDGICSLCTEEYKKGASVNVEGNSISHYYPSCKDLMFYRMRNGAKPSSLHIHCVYKITHKESGKFYIGRHRWTPNEKFYDYLGSGNEIKSAINKDGNEYFVKEILKDYLTWWESVCLEGNLIYSAFLDAEQGGKPLYNSKLSFRRFNEDQLDSMGVPLDWVWD